MIKIKSERFFKIIFIFSVITFVSSVGFKLYLCNSMAVKNGEFERAFLAQQEMEKYVEKLSFESAALSSISYVEGKSREMGFVEMTEKLISIDPSAPVQVASLTQR